MSTPATRFGLFVGAKVRVSNACHDNYAGYRDGDVVTLEEELSSGILSFANTLNHLTYRMYLRELDQASILELNGRVHEDCTNKALKRPASVTMNNTPATRAGIQVGDYFRCNDSGLYYKLERDDGTDYPFCSKVCESGVFSPNISRATKVTKEEATRVQFKVGDVVCIKIAGDGFDVGTIGVVEELSHDDIRVVGENTCYTNTLSRRPGAWARGSKAEKASLSQIREYIAYRFARGMTVDKAILQKLAELS